MHEDADQHGQAGSDPPVIGPGGSLTISRPRMSSVVLPGIETRSSSSAVVTSGVMFASGMLTVSCPLARVRNVRENGCPI